MSNRIVAYSAAAAIAAYALVAGTIMSSTVALADEPVQAGSAFGAKTVGALSAETRGLATNADAVRSQGGAATAWSVRWTGGEQEQAGSAYGYGAVGAMARESATVATSGAAVARQGGGVTANAVRWIAIPQGS